MILQHGVQLAERKDADISVVLKQVLEADGVEVRPDVQASRIKTTNSGLRLTDNVIDGTHLFVATGRLPNIDDLGLNTLSAQVNDRAGVQVDDRLGSTAAGF